jgi:hypothetical protein
MLHNNFEIRVLVKGRPVNEYPHNGQVFLEGRHGSNFEIEFKNLSPTRVEAVLSVDGLSVIDGKEAGPASSGYVVDAFQTVRIPGWKLTDEQVAAFVFAGKGKSYATQSTGSSRNNGVIGALVFAEKFKPAYVPIHHQYGQLFGGAQASPSIMRGMTKGIAPSGASGGGFSHAAGDSWTSMSLGSADASAIYAATSSTTAALNNIIGASLSNQTQATQHVIPDIPIVQTLGTGFGQATDFATTTISFERGDMSALLVLMYDDSRGLRARGIELNRPSRHRVARTNEPQAFPAMNCVPPKGWKG